MICWVVLASFLAPVVKADIVTLSDGKDVVGVILDASTRRLRLQVSADGTMTLPTETISAIKRQTPKQNAALRTRWLLEDTRRRAAEEAQRRYVAAQRAKGLEFYSGKWMTPEEADFRADWDAVENGPPPAGPRVFMVREAAPPPSPLDPPRPIKKAKDRNAR